MNDYTAAADKLFQETQHLERQFDYTGAEPVPPLPDGSIDLALAQAKRVRAASTLLVRALARHRDNLATGQEATST